MLKQPDLFYDVAVITTLYGSTKPTIDNTDTIFLHNTIFLIQLQNPDIQVLLY